MERKMKNRLLAFFALVILTAPIQPAHSSNPKMLDFIVAQAHQAGHTLCDAAIREAFQIVMGDDRPMISGRLANSKRS